MLFNCVEPSQRLSLERAREYDRVSEMLATRVLGTGSNRVDMSREFGIEARRNQFTKNSYRQPVLTQKAMVPEFYRKGQKDTLTEECRARLKDLQIYSLMHDPPPESREDIEQQSTKVDMSEA